MERIDRRARNLATLTELEWGHALREKRFKRTGSGFCSGPCIAGLRSLASARQSRGLCTTVDNLSFIGGSNLTATEARLLLMACLMKFGALSPAAKTDQPTAGETAAVQSDIPSTASCQNARRVRFPVLRLNAFRWFRGAHLADMVCSAAVPGHPD